MVSIYKAIDEAFNRWQTWRIGVDPLVYSFVSLLVALFVLIVGKSSVVPALFKVEHPPTLASVTMQSLAFATAPITMPVTIASSQSVTVSATMIVTTAATTSYAAPVTGTIGIPLIVPVSTPAPASAPDPGADFWRLAQVALFFGFASAGLTLLVEVNWIKAVSSKPSSLASVSQTALPAQQAQPRQDQLASSSASTEEQAKSNEPPPLLAVDGTAQSTQENQSQQDQPASPLTATEVQLERNETCAPTQPTTQSDESPVSGALPTPMCYFSRPRDYALIVSDHFRAELSDNFRIFSPGHVLLLSWQVNPDSECVQIELGCKGETETTEKQVAESSSEGESAKRYTTKSKSSWTVLTVEIDFQGRVLKLNRRHGEDYQKAR